MDKKVQIIAEIGCNHMGDMKIAEKMITTLSTLPNNTKPDIIKFQKRTPKEILTPEEYDAPHPNPKHAFGETYGLHREFLEFSSEQHSYLKNFVEENGLKYSCSVFDMSAAKNILNLQPKMIKISSANNNDYNLLKYIDDNYNGEIHISLGMTTQKEEEQIFKTIKNNRKNLIFYACTTAYPASEDSICLLEISRLKEQYGKDILGIGFSGHHNGIVQDIAAVALGARYLERHFTLDKTLKGTDQGISLEPCEFSQLVSNIRLTEQALAYKETDILDIEQEIRNRLKFKNKENICL